MINDELRVLCALQAVNRSMTSVELVEYDTSLVWFTTARTLQKLEEEGYVDRHVVPQDGIAALPRHSFELTEKGRFRIAHSC